MNRIIRLDSLDESDIIIIKGSVKGIQYHIMINEGDTIELIPYEAKRV